MRREVVTFVLAVAFVIAGVAGMNAQASPSVPRSEVARAASMLTGVPTTVSCVRDPKVGGERVWGWTYGPATRHIVLRSRLCLALQRGPGLETHTGVALLTLAHEAAHVGGVVDEITADCLGLSAVRPLARFFGYARSALPTIMRQARAGLTIPGSC